jgi:hypothetical protein
MILTEADFDIPPYNIPNIQKVRNTFESYRDLKEEEVLRFLLGDDIYDAFKAGVNGVDEDDIAQRWKDLRDGASYTYLGRSYRYTGLKKLLIPYFYSEWVNDHWKPFSGIGVVTPKGENATVKYPLQNIMNSWNEFCFLAGSSIAIVGRSHFHHGHHFYHRRSNYYGTLYGYLMASSQYDDLLYEMDIDAYLTSFCNLPAFKSWL